MGILDNLTGNDRRDRHTGTLTTQPFRSIYNQGTIWVGENGSVWLYMILPDFPTMFEDAPRRLEIGGQINNILEEIGKLSRDPLGSTTIGGRAREIHLITHLWYDIPRIPDRSTPSHAGFLNDIYNFLAPNKATWIGVRLWPENESAETPNTLGNLRRTVANLVGFDLDELSAYNTDLNRVRRILTVNSGRIPTDTEIRYMSSWYNAGREGDPTVVAFPDRLVIDNADDIEFTAVTKFNFIKFNPRSDTWLADALTHPEGAVVISIRGQLESSETTRRRLKQTQRKIRHQIEEEEAAVEQGDVESIENVNLAAYNKQVEDYFAQSHTPVLTNTSFVFARRARHADETFNDTLRDIYGIETKLLTHRQIDALEETLPTSAKRATQAKESLTIPMIAYSGVRSFSELGDKDGAFPGVIIPDMVPMYVSSRAASESNAPPMMTIVGVPGSGKAQTLSTVIPTPSGWVKMGDLKLGDTVLSRDGKPCTVVHLSPINETPDLYKITLDDGQEIFADADHQWVVANRYDRRNPRHPKRKAALSRWEAAQETIRHLEHAAKVFSPGQTSSLNELFEIVSEIDGIPWANAKTLYEVLTFMDCPFHLEERTSPKVYSKSETKARDLPVVFLPVRQTLETLVADWSASRAVNSPGVRGDNVRSRVAAAKSWLNEGVDAGLELHMADIGRGLQARGALNINKGFLREAGKKVRAAGVTGRSGKVNRSIPLIESTTVTREVNVYPTQVALKTLAVRLAQQHSIKPNTDIDERVLTTQEMLNEGVLIKPENRVRFSIRTTEAIILPEVDLIVPPYTLGAWLGDGCHENATMAGIDAEIMERIAADGFTVTKHESNKYTWGVAGLVTKIKRLGTYRNKHIPTEYLRASFEQRLTLLQGLMDTDGTIDKKGACEISLSDERLATDVLELIRSLGIKASKTVGPASYLAINEETGEKELRRCKDRHRIHFTTTLPVFHLPRKAERLPTKLRETQQWLYIKSIELVPPEPARCIQVDSPDSTYLCAGFVPTHNTMLLQMLAFQYALLGEPVFFLNPKADDDLTPLARLTGGTVLNISDAEPGAFDPFRFARTPELAAEAAADFLLEVLPPTTVHDKVAVRVGLSRGAKAGARSVLEALKLGMDDPQFIRSVEGLLEASSLFRIAVGTHPREPFRASKTLTLVQFDQGLNLPDPHKSPSEYSDGERLALGAQLLITNGGMQALRGEGGVIIVDEAHRWLSNSETLNQLQKLGREGRSQSLFTILATQRLGDVDTSTLLSYSPRITVLRVEEEEEAVRSLELLGLEPTGERIRWLREETKAVRGSGDEPGRAPLGLHRDLLGRHAAFMAGPYPESLMKQFSTNPLDRAERRKVEEQQQAVMRERSMMLPQGAPPPGAIGPTGSGQGQEQDMGTLDRVDERAPQEFVKRVPMQERK
jgi:hypothetical protein